ncbi:MAG: maleylpyruvate isomerase family mycothiol-dependent enzyme [Streptomycetales bacterium]
MSERIDGRWEHERYCAGLEAEMARFIEVVRHVDPATPVPSCPGWTIAVLVKHHGSTHRWVEHVVRTRANERVRSRDVEIGLPDDEADYPVWLAAGVASLVAALRAVDPDAPMWTWGPDRHARFWSRRVLHEAVVHRADAELALGREPLIAPRTAVDGIDEFLTNLPFAPRVAERLRELGGEGATLHLHSTDADGEWMITLQPDGFTWARGHGKGTVAVRAPASDLLLLTYGRRKPAADRFAVFGDQRLLERWLETSAF